MPANVPIAAPITTSLAQCLLLYMRDAAISVAPPYITGAMNQVEFGHHFDVSLVTPDGAAFEGEVEMLIVPGQDGEIGILARHAPLVATLKAGGTRVHIRRDDEIREFATGPGFFKVEQDRALALVDDAVDSRQIDPERARQQLDEANA